MPFEEAPPATLNFSALSRLGFIGEIAVERAASHADVWQPRRIWNGEIAVVGVEFDAAFSYAEDFRGSLLRFASGIPFL